MRARGRLPGTGIRAIVFEDFCFDGEGWEGKGGVDINTPFLFFCVEDVNGSSGGKKNKKNRGTGGGGGGFR